MSSAASPITPITGSPEFRPQFSPPSPPRLLGQILPKPFESPARSTALISEFLEKISLQTTPPDDRRALTGLELFHPQAPLPLTTPQITSAKKRLFADDEEQTPSSKAAESSLSAVTKAETTGAYSEADSLRVTCSSRTNSSSTTTETSFDDPTESLSSLPLSIFDTFSQRQHYQEFNRRRVHRFNQRVSQSTSQIPVPPPSPLSLEESNPIASVEEKRPQLPEKKAKTDETKTTKMDE